VTTQPYSALKVRYPRLDDLTANGIPMVVCWAFWISTRAAGRIRDVVASLQNSALSHGVTIDPISDGAEPIRLARAET
jgi:hypothetical protein